MFKKFGVLMVLSIVLMVLSVMLGVGLVSIGQTANDGSIPYLAQSHASSQPQGIVICGLVCTQCCGDCYWSAWCCLYCLNPLYCEGARVGNMYYCYYPPDYEHGWYECQDKVDVGCLCAMCAFGMRSQAPNYPLSLTK